jgi:SAM-dependent methyltransferase
VAKIRNEWAYAHERNIVRTTQDTDKLPFLKFSKNFVVLDVGCGTGKLLENLMKKFGVEAVGIDIVPTKLKGCSFVRAGAQNLPFREDVFDVLFSLGVVEHLPLTEIALLESHRVLKKKGQVLITVPNLFSLHTLFDRPLRQILGLWKIGLEKSYSIGNFYNLMYCAGYNKAKHKIILWDLKAGSKLSRAYTEFDNFLNKIFNFWGFFIALYCIKNEEHESARSNDV